jgi:murein DD-endopeptidase MepM/ murein hydrolase activator NlpD
MRIARFISSALLVPVAIFAQAALPAKTPARWTLTYQPARIVNGTPVLFRATTPRPAHTLSAKWLDHEISFTFDASQKAWFGLAGASLETKPGAYPIELRAEVGPGPALTYKQEIRVQKQRYPKVIVLKVPGRYTAPDPEQMRVIEHDKQVKAEAFKALTAEREWKGSFQRPVSADISDVFGVQRVFNGAVQSTHQGLDFRVPTGTVVSAVNDGTVILARSLYFEGNCIVIDHGQGLLTLYLHLSEMRVKEGERVAKGQSIALSGGTGRATGPHLHLAVRWQGVYLNPAGLLSLHLP